ncbi:hypothetical protein MOBT1_001626 [Malassezia obtusa]|uniref:TFIIS N-terminal domain-containing protein n=1 Tax=Malassezia obtusa TaxID=76774 RepID=A0AAF0E3N4_9BASI|nr:hypothetical protein MOBT1_001626 [Malassezia obtusa]
MAGAAAPPGAPSESNDGGPSPIAYATPTIPKYDYTDNLTPPPPRAAPTTPFTPADQHNIARSAPVVLSRNLVEQNPSQAAGALITLLSSNAPGSLTLHPTTPEERVLIVHLMRDVGTPDYLKAFSHDIRGREILAAWLSDATPPRKADVADESEKWKEVLCPLLELLLQLPISLDHLKDHVGLGKLITGAQKRARSEQARKLADAVKDKWSALVPARPSPAEARESPPVAPKRPAASTPSEGAKRARSTTPPAATRPTNPLLQSTRVPSERKASPQLPEPRIPTRPAAAGKPANDPLATARRSVRSAPAATNAHKDLAGFMSLIDQQPAQTPAAPAPAPSSAPLERKKRKKAVHWKDYDGMPLVAVKLIEAAVYDEDGDTAARGAGAMDIEEGGVFRQAHAEMDEQIDWYTPRDLLLSDPESGPLPLPGSASEAKLAQEQREKTVLSAVYMDASEIPASPAEPDDFVLSFAALMPPPKPMKTGLPGEPASETIDAPAPDFSAMAAMLGRGGPPGADASMPPVPPMPFDPAMLSSMMQSAQNGGDSNSDMPPMPMPPWMGGGMPFPFPFPPPPDVMAQMQGGASPARASDPPEAREGASRSSRKLCKYYKKGERYVATPLV